VHHLIYTVEDWNSLSNLASSLFIFKIAISDFFLIYILVQDCLCFQHYIDSGFEVGMGVRDIFLYFSLTLAVLVIAFFNISDHENFVLMVY